MKSIKPRFYWGDVCDPKCIKAQLVAYYKNIDCKPDPKKKSEDGKTSKGEVER